MRRQSDVQRGSVGEWESTLNTFVSTKDDSRVRSCFHSFSSIVTLVTSCSRLTYSNELWSSGGPDPVSREPIREQHSSVLLLTGLDLKPAKPTQVSVGTMWHPIKGYVIMISDGVPHLFGLQAPCWLCGCRRWATSGLWLTAECVCRWATTTSLCVSLSGPVRHVFCFTTRCFTNFISYLCVFKNKQVIYKSILLSAPFNSSLREKTTNRTKNILMLKVRSLPFNFNQNRWRIYK